MDYTLPAYKTANAGTFDLGIIMVYCRISTTFVKGTEEIMKNLLKGNCNLAMIICALAIIGGGALTSVHAQALTTTSPKTTVANASTDSPNTLNPIPLRELYTKPNQMYLYSSSWSEVTAAQQSYGLTLSSQRPIGYVFSNSGADTTPLYRLQQKATGNWLVTASQSEETALVNSGAFTLEGSLGNIYTSQIFGAQPLNRYTNGKGWRLAY